MDWESGALALRGGEPYTLEGDEAVKLWVRLALDARCARWRYSAHSGDYGNGACRAARQERRRGHPREPAQEDHHRDAARLPVPHGRGGLSFEHRADGATVRFTVKTVYNSFETEAGNGMNEGRNFAAMEKAYTGAGSTVEGSFAGDLLRACADGCAELWSTEIDGLEERAFVASAAGEWLTRVCADRGVERRAGEDDETLRSRRARKPQAAGATATPTITPRGAARWRAFCACACCPSRAARGRWTLSRSGRTGRAASAAAVAAAQSVVDEKRPIGADAKVFAAVEKPLNIAASVVLSEGASLEGVVNAFKGAFTAFCREGALTTRLVSYARVSAILLDQEGVADVTAFTLGGAGTSFALGEREIGVPGTVTLTEVTA